MCPNQPQLSILNDQIVLLVSHYVAMSDGKTEGSAPGFEPDIMRLTPRLYGALSFLPYWIRLTKLNTEDPPIEHKLYGTKDELSLKQADCFWCHSCKTRLIFYTMLIELFYENTQLPCGMIAELCYLDSSLPLVIPGCRLIREISY